MTRDQRSTDESEISYRYVNFLRGRDGRDGDDGKDGLDGVQGPRGAPGRDGKNGERGDPGIQGPPTLPFGIFIAMQLKNKLSRRLFACKDRSASRK